MTTRYDLEILIRTKKQGNGITEADKEVKNFGQRLNGALDIMSKSAAAALAAGATFKKAFELSQEGAEINQLTESFEGMNARIFQIPGLLEKMQQASRGTIADVTLMEGVLKLSAGASDQMARKLAEATPKLLEIAKASNKLNPALGDTAFLYESIATGIKRGSPLILDNLGIVIKVGEANEKFAASIGKAVSELTAEEKQMALLNATLESGDTLIRQAGGNVDSQADAWARLGVRVEQAQNRLKSFLANGLEPVIAAMAGDHDKATEQIITGNLEAANSMADLVEEAQKLSDVFGMGGGLAAAIAGTEGQIIAGIQATGRAIAVQADSLEEFQAATEAFTGRARQAWQAYLKTLGLTEEQYFNIIKAGQQVESSDRAMMNALAPHNEAREGQHRVLEKITDDMAKMMIEAGQLASWEGRMAAAMNEANLVTASQTQAFVANQIAMQLQNAEAEKVVAANAALVGAFRATEGPIRALLEAEQLAMESQGRWVQTTRNTSGEITKINEQLAADLNEDQRNAYQEILNTVAEGSGEWLAAWNALQADLTASQRAELIAQRADLEAAQGQIGSAYTGSIEDMRKAKEAAIEANAQMVASYRELAFEGSLALAELSPDPEAFQRTLEYGVAIGAITQKEADLREEAANTRLALDEVNQELATGKITAEEAAQRFEAIVNGQKGVSVTSRNLKRDTEGLHGAFSGLFGPLDGIISRLNSLDGRHVRTVVEVNETHTGGNGSGGGKSSGDKALGGSVFAGTSYRVGEGNRPELFKSGNNLFMIPGEDGRVFSNEQSQGLLGGQQIIIQQLSVTINGARIPPNSRAFGRAAAAAVVDQLGAVV